MRFLMSGGSFLFMMFLASCTLKLVDVDVWQEATLKLDNGAAIALLKNGEGIPNINQRIDASGAQLTTETEQSAESGIENVIPIGQDGGTAVAKGTAEKVKSNSDKSQKNVGNPKTTTTITTQTSPASTEILPEITVLDLDTTETYELHWSAPEKGRGRWVTWLDKSAEFYGVPIKADLTGGCIGTYVIEKLDPVFIGSTSFTVVDDFHYGSDNPKAAEVLAPLSCTGPVKLTLFYKAKGVING